MRKQVEKKVSGDENVSQLSHGGLSKKQRKARTAFRLSLLMMILLLMMKMMLLPVGDNDYDYGGDDDDDIGGGGNDKQRAR